VPTILLVPIELQDSIGAEILGSKRGLGRRLVFLLPETRKKQLDLSESKDFVKIPEPWNTEKRNVTITGGLQILHNTQA
jgi:hypothetical protein